MQKKPLRGFTLIELSIVLVIIGLIVGGIIAGKDMIVAATVRAQISQIEKYQTAVNTFRTKYNYLPGDIPDPDASRFGFVSRVSATGEGDGNGAIEGITCSTCISGEALLFWQDLSTAHLIDGSFNSVTATSTPSVTSQTQINTYFPQAKIGDGPLYVLAYSFGGINFFGIGNVQAILRTIFKGDALSVAQAYNIDKKIDDGLPTTGTVLTITTSNAAAGVGWGLAWMPNVNELDGINPPLVSLPPNALNIGANQFTCFDNNFMASPVYTYSLSYYNGQSKNCELGIRFQ